MALVRTGRTVSSLARDLGVTTRSLGRWVQAAHGRQAQRESATLAAATSEQRELRRLEQENDSLRQQRDRLIGMFVRWGVAISNGHRTLGLLAVERYQEQLVEGGLSLASAALHGVHAGHALLVASPFEIFCAHRGTGGIGAIGLWNVGADLRLTSGGVGARLVRLVG